MKRTVSKTCKDTERLWRDFCVDKNLQDGWLERLNGLETLNLVGICEGHPDRPPGAAGRFPQINLRLKEAVLPGIADHWRDLRSAMLNEASKLFLLGDTDVRIELRFWLRAGRGKLIYQEDLTMRLRSYQARNTLEMDAETQRWFERAVDRIARIDQTVLTWHGHDLLAK
jgi:hypothetical protein